MDIAIDDIGRAETTTAIAPRLTETYWGYSIDDGTDADHGEDIAGAAMRFLGLVLLLSAYGQWLLPASMFAGDPFLMKASLAAVLGASGVAIYWIAARGRRPVVEVDLSRRELRDVKITAQGARRVHRIIQMSAVESAFIRRRSDEGPDELHLNLTSGAPLHIANGTEAELMPLYRRLAADMMPARDKVDLKLAESVPFSSVRSDA